MNDNVIDLGGRTAKVAGTPNADVVEQLLGLLELAKSGEMQQLAFVYVDRFGVPIDGYVPGGTAAELVVVIGGLELCKAELLSHMVGAGTS